MNLWTSTPRVRPAAVAGTFYPADPHQLRAMVRRMLDQVQHPSARSPAAPAATGAGWPKAIIVPHAGFVYSGPIAATVYARVAQGKGTIQRVVLLGPAHHVLCHNIVASGAAAFATPLGNVPVDRAAWQSLAHLPFVHVADEAHAPEHSLEVQLPFLIEVLGRFAIVPLLFGRANPEQVRAVFAALWGGPETLLVVSSDLSHYMDYAAAGKLDRATAMAIQMLQPDEIGPEQACGRIAVQGLLAAAKEKNLRAELVDLRNSGDTAGSKDEVVGYGAFTFN